MAFWDFLPEAMSKKTKKRVAKSRKLAPLFWSLIGLFCILLFISYKVYKSYRLSFTTPPTKTYSERQVDRKPISLYITRFDLRLPIKETTIKNGRWEIFEEGVSHLSTSADPGISGAIILYGHNKKNILGPLSGVTIGDPINIKASDGKEYSYIVKEKLVVNPNQVEILDSGKKEMLILYTCTGFADTRRLVVKAYPL